MSLGPDRAKSRGNKSMHISCSTDFGSATPLAPHMTAVSLAVRPRVLSFPPTSIDLPHVRPSFFPPLLFLLPDLLPSSAVQSRRGGSHVPPAAALAVLISIFTQFPAYRVDIIKAPPQRRAHLLSCPFYTFPSLFPSFCVSLSLALPLLLAHCWRI